MAEINKMLSGHLGNPTPTPKDIKIKKEHKKSNGKSGEESSHKEKKPAGAFFLFSNEYRETIKKNYPGMKPTEISESLGKLWAELDARDKAEYKIRYKT